MTITLQDVVVILGLRIDGPKVTRSDDRDWDEEYETARCSAPGDNSEGWSNEVDVALPVVHRDSGDRCTSPAACTWLHPQQDRYCLVSGLLHK